MVIIRVRSQADLVCLRVLLIEVDSVLAVHISVLVRQTSAVDNLEEKVQILANQFIRTVHELVILLSVLLAFLVTWRNLDLMKKTSKLSLDFW